MFLVGVMGVVPALGQIQQPPEDCIYYPPQCFNQCVELNACRADGPIGRLECQSEERNLRACRDTTRVSPLPGFIVSPIKPKEPEKPKEPVITYHAGKYLKPSSIADIILGVTHADVQSYKMVDGKKTMGSTSGFYPKDEKDAEKQLVFYKVTKLGGNPTVIHTPGEILHTATTDCSVPQVDEERFNNVRTLASLLIWKKFHYVKKNSDHWSSDVVRVK